MHRFMKITFIALLFSCTYLNAQSMFLLTKIPKAYLVVENYSEKIPMSLKEDIYDEMRVYTKELKIDTTGYSFRTLGFMINDTRIADKNILTLELILGEEVTRLDDKENVYALTFQKKNYIDATNKDNEELAEELMDNVDLLLNDFSEQYKEDNEEWDYY